MVAIVYFPRLGHDNHRRLSKLCTWEEKKSKTSWGAQTVDYEKIAAAAVQAMKAAARRRQVGSDQTKTLLSAAEFSRFAIQPSVLRREVNVDRDAIHLNWLAVQCRRLIAPLKDRFF
jgi:hypothetical protein